MDHSVNIINKIRRNSRVRKLLIFLCVLVFFSCLMTFLFYGLDSTSNVIKFIAKAKKSQQLEKVMLNPRIKFEYKEGQFYDIVASKAINKGQDNVELFDVTATSNAGNIKAGKLLVTNDGNNLHFSDHPVLIIKESKNNEQ